jgi:hypothetical protein
MLTDENRWFGALVLAGVYALGLMGIIASSGSSGGGDEISCALEVGAIAPARDGSNDVWIGVLADTTDDNYYEVVRVDSSGLVVTSFSVAQGAQNGLVKALAIDALNAGDVYVGGAFDRGILRLNADGSEDPGFVVGSGFNGNVNSIVAATDGSGDIYVGGNFTQYKGTLVSGLVRLTSNGVLLAGNYAGVSNVEGVVPAVDPPLLLGFVYSASATLPTAARWESNGQQDTTNFNPASISTEYFAVAPAADASGAVYFGGNAGTGVVRLNVNGTNDGGFDGSDFDARIQTIVLAGDMTGDIYVGGGFSSYNGLPANGIIRLAYSDGSRSPGFNINIGDGFTYDANDPASTGSVQAIARAETGTDIYAGGSFAYYDGSRSNGIARLNANGTLDKGFSIEITVGGESCANDSLTAIN